MKILALDTSGPYAGAALMENGAVTHEIAACHGLTHSQTAMPMLDQALEAAGLTITECNAQGEWRNITARKEIVFIGGCHDQAH